MEGSEIEEVFLNIEQMRSVRPIKKLRKFFNYMKK